MSLFLIIISAIFFGIFIGLFLPMLFVYVLNFFIRRKINKEKDYWIKKCNEQKNKFKEVQNVRETGYEQERCRRKEFGRTIGGGNSTIKEHAKQSRDKSNDAGSGGVSLSDATFTLRD